MLVLPIEVKALLTYLITQGVKAFLSLFGKDISGGASAITAVVVGSVLFFIEGILELVPAEFIPVAESGLALLAVILGSFGTHYTYKNI